MNEKDEIPRKRGRYKRYAEPDDPERQVPRQTILSGAQVQQIGDHVINDAQIPIERPVPGCIQDEPDDAALRCQVWEDDNEEVEASGSGSCPSTSQVVKLSRSQNAFGSQRMSTQESDSESDLESFKCNQVVQACRLYPNRHGSGEGQDLSRNDEDQPTLCNRQLEDNNLEGEAQRLCMSPSRSESDLENSSCSFQVQACRLHPNRRDSTESQDSSSKDEDQSTQSYRQSKGKNFQGGNRRFHVSPSASESDLENSSCSFQVQACRVDPSTDNVGLCSTTQPLEDQLLPSAGAGEADADDNFDHPFLDEDMNLDIHPYISDGDEIEEHLPPEDEVEDRELQIDNALAVDYALVPEPVAQPVPQAVENDVLKRKLLGEYADRIQDSVNVSRGEVLLNALEFCDHYNLPLAAQEDMHRLINSLFYKEVIPESKYKIDQLFSSGTKTQYHFFCSECFEDFGVINNKVVKSKICENCDHENNFSDLTKASFYVTFDIVSQFQLLLDQLKPTVHSKNPKDFSTLENSDIMTDLYDGKMYREFASSLDYSKDITYISFTACTDGTPVFKSSNCSIWPLFVMVNELPPDIRMGKILIAGLWFNKHPIMDLFLDGFTEYVTSLSTQGFMVRIAGINKHCKAYLIACCVDSGARGSVQGIHSHSGAFSCNWCLHPGMTEGDGSSAQKFLMLANPPTKRTQEEVVRDGREALRLNRKHAHVNGVIGLSPLLRAPKFNIVDGMIVDELHWANFGIGRQIFKIWMGERLVPPPPPPGEKIVRPPYYIGTPETKKIINERIHKLHPPKEVRRMPRDLSDFAHWNAREWENVILYYSIPILKNILPIQYLNHWALFVQALYLLLQSKVTRTDIQVAKELLHMFVRDVENLYSWKEMTFNVHISEHAAENVERWGPMWCVSTFAFENGNGKLKKKLHAERGIPHQVIRSLWTDSSLNVLRLQAQTAPSLRFQHRLRNKSAILKMFYVKNVACMIPSLFEPSREQLWLCGNKGINVENFSKCKKIIIDNVCYSSFSGGKTDNSVVCLRNGTIVKIRAIIARENSEEVFIFVSKVRCSPFAVTLAPRHAQFSPFMYMVNIIEEESHIVDWTELCTVCVNMSVNCMFFKGHFISVMPNTFNKF